jgi:hypothetical protein
MKIGREAQPYGVDGKIREMEDAPMRLMKPGVFGAITLAVATLTHLTDAYARNAKPETLGLKPGSFKTAPVNPPMTLRHGGPDGGGYYYIDSDDDAQNAPIFEWVDISGIGTEITMGDDQNQGPFSLGFSFTFYGNPFNGIRICSNGFLSFTSISNAYNNVQIPSTADPNNLLALFWDDLDPTAGGHVYYYSDTTNHCFIISYDGVPFYVTGGGGTGSIMMQVILHQDGNIFYQYGALDGGLEGLESATVGIENSTGAIGTQYLFNQAGIHNDMAIYFGLTPPIFFAHDVRPTAFLAPPPYVRAGNPITPVVIFFNNGTSIESFPVRLTINHNGEVYNQVRPIDSLNSFASVNVTFPDYTPPELGAYQLVAISELPGDMVPVNDTLRAEFNAFVNIVYEGFEATDGNFVGDNDWQWGTPTSGPNGAHSGVNVWATVLNGDYQVGPGLSRLVTPSFALGNTAVLTFWHWYDIEHGLQTAYDGGNVKISTDDGSSWEIIFPQGGYPDTLSTGFENPIGGEPAFSGASHGWVLATFVLTDYGGATVKFKFDFGSDNSITRPGWYLDDFTLVGGGLTGPGWVAGSVTDLASGSPIAGAIVETGSLRDTTDASGNYHLDLMPDTYILTASALYHNRVTVVGVTVIEGDTTTQSFALPAPMIQADTTAIDTSLNLGQTAIFTRSIVNNGNGPLDFDISITAGGGSVSFRPRVRIHNNEGVVSSAPDHLASATAEYAPGRSSRTPETILDFGEEVFTFDPQTPTGDAGCLGVEFDGTYFWVTGRHGQDQLHKLHKYDHDGNHIASFDQGTTSLWGWRDLAWDGAYLYGSDEDELAVIDPAIGQKVATLPMPTSIEPPMRALAWDPAADHFWSANFSSNIIEFDRNGQTIHSFPNTLNAYGMAWDAVSPGGPWLWVYSQDGIPATRISQFDPRIGDYTGVSFYAVDHNGGAADLAGGACLTTKWNPALAVLFCLVQGTTTGNDSEDLIQGYEITPYFPWLPITPSSGTIPAGGQANLIITVDFRGQDIVPDSSYRAVIVIDNNSAITPHIPVTAVSGPVGINEDIPDLPREFGLYQNFPNPFNPATEIRFTLPFQSDVRLEIFNILGQKISTLVNGLMPAGYHSAIWNGNSAASGIYFYKLTAGDFQKVRQMTLIK